MGLTMCKDKKCNIWLLQFFGLLGLLALCMWLILHPKEPSYTIVDFSVPTKAGGDGRQAASLRNTIDIMNQNKDSSIYYNDILLKFSYLQDTLGNDTIPSFHQAKDKTTPKEKYADANVKVLRAFVKQMMNATTELKVDLITSIQYSTWRIKSKHHQMHLQGSIPIGADGNMAGKDKKVKLHNSKKWKFRSNFLH